MSGDDHFVKPDNDLTSTNVARALRKLYGTHPVCMQAADEIDLLVEALAKDQKTIRHWREEVAKLHSQIDRLKADLRAWEITARRADEAEASQFPDDGSCLRCGAAPRNASGLCATCVDEDAIRAGEISDMAGVAEQSGTGAPETSVRCGAPAAK